MNQQEIQAARFTWGAEDGDVEFDFETEFVGWTPATRVAPRDAKGIVRKETPR